MVSVKNSLAVTSAISAALISFVILQNIGITVSKMITDLVELAIVLLAALFIYVQFAVYIVYIKDMLSSFQYRIVIGLHCACAFFQYLSFIINTEEFEDPHKYLSTIAFGFTAAAELTYIPNEKFFNWFSGTWAIFLFTLAVFFSVDVNENYVAEYVFFYAVIISRPIRFILLGDNDKKMEIKTSSKYNF